jgi:molybdopterin converting factor small subunit
VKITLKLYANLSRYLPPGAQDNAIDLDVPEGTTVGQLLEKYSIPRAEAHLVLVNGVYRNSTTEADSPVAAGDAVAMWPPVAGG